MSATTMNIDVPPKEEAKRPQKPVLFPGEPSLYDIPQDLEAEYQPLPFEVQLGAWLFSVLLSAVVCFGAQVWLSPMTVAQTGSFSWTAIISFFTMALSMVWLLTAFAQDFLVHPTRISTKELMEQYHLPSEYSRFETVGSTEGDGSGLAPQGVHFLCCEAERTKSADNTGLIYVNHGLGASSLSWLPAMKPLVNHLGYRCVMGHDAPGFGFTDRPRDFLEAYTTRGSAEIGSNLLNKHTNSDSERVLLMGHSMGTVATLRMALDLPDHVEKRVVLVDPALGMRPNQWATAPKKQFPVSNWFQAAVVEPVGSFVLRQLVGRPGFWRDGLQLVWGDSNLLSDADVMRFQWPAIGQGWEKGMLAFARAQLIRMESTDRELLEKVLAKPNTTVDVIYGSHDNITWPGMIQSFFEPYPSVQVIELEGLGHDPFEEDVGAFMAALRTVLKL